MKQTNTFDKHQRNIVTKTPKMNTGGASAIGRMTKAEARDFLKSIASSDSRVRKTEANRNVRAAKIGKDILRDIIHVIDLDTLHISPDDVEKLFEYGYFTPSWAHHAISDYNDAQDRVNYVVTKTRKEIVEAWKKAKTGKIL